ncbi:hypothetical protein GCM10020256_02830 [Streptomyces thermocoprophilus]
MLFRVPDMVTPIVEVSFAAAGSRPGRVGTGGRPGRRVRVLTTRDSPEPFRGLILARGYDNGLSSGTGRPARATRAVSGATPLRGTEYDTSSLLLARAHPSTLPAAPSPCVTHAAPREPLRRRSCDGSARQRLSS